MPTSSQITENVVSPQAYFNHSTLGLMVFNDDDNTWVGQYNNYRYHIIYEAHSQPVDDQLAYCIEFLSNKNWLDNMLPTEISRVKSTLAASFHHEVDSLKYLTFMFYRPEAEPQLLIQLAPDGKVGDENQNLWHMKFVGKKCHSFVADH